jgi:hypothetical protein
MIRPSDRAIAQAFFKVLADPSVAWRAEPAQRFLDAVASEAARLDAAAPDGAQFVTGTVEAVGSDENGQPRILIHTTREALRDGPMLACRDVYVSTAPPSLGGEDAARLDWLESARGELFVTSGGLRAVGGPTCPTIVKDTYREAIDDARAAEGGE